ncbi:cupredoxin family protein [Paucibacter sp. B2R-40]|uniref:cupredoxin domain-containing protein n=1 Tax=Paucibacter sp. B2R-40 TaxID=2893554 RepID=UPI0021E3FC99|nr:cupredoxin family protein [Paucibacter sp. B2R-40]MCV2355824.1 cupredoxin family protein [Paucibacter sp. B2R-40]
MKTVPYKEIALALLGGFLALAVNMPAAAHGDQAHASKPGSANKVQQIFGVAGEAKAVTRSIQISMSDAMRFTPELIEVKQGETIKFVFKNEGQVLHEFVIGSKDSLAEHAAMMLKFPNMEHDEPYMAHVQPGKTGEIVWTFNRAGEFDFACLIAGHYQAGMVGRIKVRAPGKS